MGAAATGQACSPPGPPACTKQKPPPPPPAAAASRRRRARARTLLALARPRSCGTFWLTRPLKSAHASRRRTSFALPVACCLAFAFVVEEERGAADVIVRRVEALERPASRAACWPLAGRSLSLVSPLKHPSPPPPPPSPHLSSHHREVHRRLAARVLQKRVGAVRGGVDWWIGAGGGGGGVDLDWRVGGAIPRLVLDAQDPPPMRRPAQAHRYTAGDDARPPRRRHAPVLQQQLRRRLVARRDRLVQRRAARARRHDVRLRALGEQLGFL